MKNDEDREDGSWNLTRRDFNSFATRKVVALAAIME